MCVNVEDLTQLQILDSESVKKCLLLRYQQKNFYTWAGPTLVVLNPLKMVPELYAREIMQLFAHENFTYTNPHIYALGQRALRHLQWGLGKTHQAIVVNGESGAGKTYSALHLLSYLAAMETNNNEIHQSENIEVLLCKSNPLLESIGNAQTLRNTNSSRFGKLIRLVYKGEGSSTELFSAHIETYLLETTRVAQQAVGERNFHIFYQMLAGLPTVLRKEFHLEDNVSWSIASSRDCTKNDEIEFHSTMEALQQLNLGATVMDLWKLLAALLHLGNLDFFLNNQLWGTNSDHLQFATKLLGLEAEDLLNAITIRNLHAGQNVVTRPCSTQSECASRRDTLIRLLYRLMFNNILSSINLKLTKNSFNCAQFSDKYLCILDLYGFESFEHGNSLEQLCINYANERLQHFFTIHYLKEQQNHLVSEGLSFIQLDVHVEDKKNLISFLDGPVSVFGVLNEECYLNRGCDDSQVCLRIQSSLNERTRGTKSVPPPSPRATRSNNNKAPPVLFAINHYAGLVTYSTVSMLNKNRDQVPEELVTLLSESKDQYIRQISAQEYSNLNCGSKTGRKHTVLAKFKNSLDNLMKILNSCDAHYVRCIRPTMGDFQSVSWDEDYVESQLIACGVIDTVKVSSFGYPVRMSHAEFANRYRSLVARKRHDTCHLMETCQRIIESYEIEQEIRVGKSLVYATEHGIELTEQWKHRSRYLAAAAVQRWWRAKLKRRQAAGIVQHWWRAKRRQRAAVRVQTWWRQKVSTAKLLSNLKQMADSYRLIKRAVARWVHGRRRAKQLQVNTCLIPLPDENENDVPLAAVPQPGDQVSKSFDTSKLQLRLPRTVFFYSEGIISVRRPFPIRARFFTRKTCLPYSHILPKSLMPSGLMDALL